MLQKYEQKLYSTYILVLFCRAQKGIPFGRLKKRLFL